jgi:hypothetical protein
MLANQNAFGSTFPQVALRETKMRKGAVHFAFRKSTVLLNSFSIIVNIDSSTRGPWRVVMVLQASSALASLVR